MSTQATNVTRRRCLQLLAGVTAGAAGVGSSTFTDDVAAMPNVPIGPSIGASYLAREVAGITGGETVEPGSSTPEAIAESWYRTGQYAIDHDNVTLQTLWNRMQDARTIAYVRAKTAALKAMENGESSTFVENTARQKVTEHYATVQTNLANHWATQLNKIYLAGEEYKSHSDIDNPDLFMSFLVGYHCAIDGDYPHNGNIRQVPEIVNEELSLVDGSTMEVPRMELHGEHSETFSNGNTSGGSIDYTIGLTSHSGSTGHNDLDLEPGVYVTWRIPATVLPDTDSYRGVNFIGNWGPNQDPLTAEEAATAMDQNNENFGDWQRYNQYRILWSKIIDEHDQMLDNISTTVNEMYGAVQADEKTVEELVAADPYVLGQQFASDYQDTGHLAYAAADLAIMGLSFDSENKMVLRLDDGTTLEGTLYMSDEDYSIDVGKQVDPAASSAMFYVAADTATMSRSLPAGEYHEQIDGGVFKLNVGTIKDTQYTVVTSHDETVTIAWDAFSIEETTANQDVQLVTNAESAQIDLTDQLEQPITSVESVTHSYMGDEEAMVMELTEPFTITEAYDVETGDSVDVVTGEGYDAGTSSVDFSWTEQYLEMRDNTDDYAENTGSGGGGASLNWNGFDWSWIPSPFGIGGALGGTIKLIIVAALAWLGYDELIRDDG